jgi:hypothetical protein
VRDHAHSRRGIFAPHAGERLRVRRCPVCQWAVEQDHAEALAMHASSTHARPCLLPPKSSASSAPSAETGIVDVDFALV